MVAAAGCTAQDPRPGEVEEARDRPRLVRHLVVFVHRLARHAVTGLCCAWEAVWMARKRSVRTCHVPRRRGGGGSLGRTLARSRSALMKKGSILFQQPLYLRRLWHFHLISAKMLAICFRFNRGRVYNYSHIPLLHYNYALSQACLLI